MKIKQTNRGCVNCSKKLNRWATKFCSNKCQISYQHQAYIKEWKKGRVSGQQGIGVVSQYVKNYLRVKFKNKCCLCGWSKINVKIGYSPLVADHIGGNWRNNKEENLRLICPNCDSLTATYAGLNRGKGRGNRKISKRAQECRELLTNRPN